MKLFINVTVLYLYWHISPLSFGLAVMFPTQSGFRGRDSLLCLLTLIHSRAHTFTQTQQHAVTQDLSAFLSVTWQTYRVWLEETNEAFSHQMIKTQIWHFRMKFKVKAAQHLVSDHRDHKEQFRCFNKPKWIFQLSRSCWIHVHIKSQRLSTFICRKHWSRAQTVSPFTDQLIDRSLQAGLDWDKKSALTFLA